MRPPKVPKAGAMAFTTRHTGEDQLRPFNFSSSRTLQQTTDQGATATLETETAFDRDARWVGIGDASRLQRLHKVPAVVRNASACAGQGVADPLNA